MNSILIPDCSHCQYQLFFLETRGLELGEINQIFEKGGITGGVWGSKGGRTTADMHYSSIEPVEPKSDRRSDDVKTDKERLENQRSVMNDRLQISLMKLGTTFRDTDSVNIVLGDVAMRDQTNNSQFLCGRNLTSRPAIRLDQGPIWPRCNLTKSNYLTEPETKMLTVWVYM
ncbi:hypothetical protein GYMLUDRAFT_63119 [Collybiopsis luxurians FD-317 M1]|uniref:Uncharacterized protein n=1 Tax=Collybiopsis luxurians FD-317 M1 TaxID=944289 RepID=A0A0D0BID2_9AGAR|nr:hypothetical protein GYMLUDRAFT_63119 [Collybiopsis luxurians FD-317 M1]